MLVNLKMSLSIGLIRKERAPRRGPCLKEPGLSERGDGVRNPKLDRLLSNDRRKVITYTVFLRIANPETAPRDGLKKLPAMLYYVQMHKMGSIWRDRKKNAASVR